MIQLIPGPTGLRRVRPVMLGLLTLSLLAGPLRAQQGEAELRPGDRVRLWAPFAGFAGEHATMVDRRERTLVLRRHGATRRVPMADVEQLEVRRRVGDHLGRGALVGGITGAAAATVFLVPFCGDPDTVCEADEVFRVIGLVGVPPLLVGSLVGLAVPRHAWLEVGLEPGPEGRPGAGRRDVRLEAGVEVPVP